MKKNITEKNDRIVADKLSIARETVRSLRVDEVQRVVGGCPAPSHHGC